MRTKYFYSAVGLYVVAAGALGTYLATLSACSDQVEFAFWPRLLRIGTYDFEIRGKDREIRCSLTLTDGKWGLNAPRWKCSEGQLMAKFHEGGVSAITFPRVPLPAQIRITQAGNEIYADTVRAGEGAVTQPGCQWIQRTVTLR